MASVHRIFTGNQKGMSLIEVLVALAIISVASFALLTLSSAQQTAIKNLEQKQEIIALRSTLSQLFASKSVCDWQLRDLVVDVSGVSGSFSNDKSVSLTRDKIYSGPDTTSAALAEVGEPMNYSPNGPEVSFLKLGQFYKISDDVYFASLIVGIDPDSTVMTLRDLTVPYIIIQTRASDPESGKTVLACGSPADKGDLYPTWPNLLTCSDTVWHIRSPGQYNCFRGGEVTTRSAIVKFDLTTRLPVSVDNETDTSNRCIFEASCFGKTIDQMREEGLAR